MDQVSLSPLAGWANFYVIIGSSAGALTGLQFVVMTLIMQARKQASAQDIRAFGTPTVVHFFAALLISGMMTVPWPSLVHLNVGLAAGAVLGLMYAGLVLWHAWKASYSPDAEDWVWYGLLPLLAYAGLGTAAAVLRWHLTLCLFVIAAIALVLLVIGVHNAWDTVTYVAISGLRQRDDAAHDG